MASYLRILKDMRNTNLDLVEGKMKKLLSLLMCFVLMFSMMPSFANETGNYGKLVIVGGALRADNDDVYNAFIELAGGVENAKIGIVPAASGSPSKYAKMFTEDMVARGLDKSQVVVLPLLTKDDSKTEEVDESDWIKNGNNAEVAKQVEGLTGIWFIGGDQIRITDVLLNADGSETLVLTAMKKMYHGGGVIGGTSAGAAIMSETMIAGGDSLSALDYGYTENFDDSSLDYQNAGGLVVTKGLGFFKDGIVDQHFDRKARLGRLAVVAYDHKSVSNYAYGVEENTALIFDAGTQMIRVAGTGGVVILDATNARSGNGYDGFLVSYIEGNDQYDLSTHTALMDADKYTTLGYEYLNTPETVVGGSMGPNQRFRDFIAFELVDNEAKSEVKTYLFGEGKNGFEFTFRNGETTEGYWGQSGAADLYSFENVEMDIHPIKIDIQRADLYKVREGDALWKIAKNHGVSLEALKKANALKNPNQLVVGQVLNIPKK